MRYASHLLESLDSNARPASNGAQAHPAIATAHSGLMALTGHPQGQPVLTPAPLVACAQGALLALRTLAPGRLPPEIDGGALLTERAAIARLTRRGTISPGGACRILATATSPIAVNLPRASDWQLLPAWLEDPAWRESSDPVMWQRLAEAAARRRATELVERGRLLGLPVAEAAPAVRETRWFESSGRPFARAGDPRRNSPAESPREPPLVIDMSALWAGPLCGHLLALLGARVIKAESLSRPDGTRAGQPEFFDLLNWNKETVAFDLRSARGRTLLLSLVSRADIVIEASRPRALRQLGIEAESVLRRRPHATWVSISGYGRQEPEASWVALGDDAGVAAGLTSLLQEVTGDWLICGDAIADPLAGLHAALAAWRSHLSGGGRLLAISLRQVATHAATFELPDSRSARRARYAEWLEVLRSCGEPIALARARACPAHARPLGADTRAIVEEFRLT